VDGREQQQQLALVHGREQQQPMVVVVAQVEVEVSCRPQTVAWGMLLSLHVAILLWGGACVACQACGLVAQPA
jgi:hypothetical protein